MGSGGFPNELPSAAHVAAQLGLPLSPVIVGNVTHSPQDPKELESETGAELAEPAGERLMRQCHRRQDYDKSDLGRLQHGQLILSGTYLKVAVGYTTHGR
jgi:hypothetical protein